MPDGTTKSLGANLPLLARSGAQPVCAPLQLPGHRPLSNCLRLLFLCTSVIVIRHDVTIAFLHALRCLHTSRQPAPAKAARSTESLQQIGLPPAVGRPAEQEVRELEQTGQSTNDYDEQPGWNSDVFLQRLRSSFSSKRSRSKCPSGINSESLPAVTCRPRRQVINLKISTSSEPAPQQGPVRRRPPLARAWT